MTPRPQTLSTETPRPAPTPADAHPKATRRAIALSMMIVGGAFHFANPAQAQSPPSHRLAGTWWASLACPGGAIRFQLEFSGTREHPEAAVINGPERISIPTVQIDGDKVRLIFDHYDSRITATLMNNGAYLSGTWKKKAAGDSWTRLPFSASRKWQHRASVSRPEVVNGRWAVRFSKSEGPAVGVFHVDANGIATGTFLTATGDYRYLAGTFREKFLHLSCFDGAHAFLFTAVLQSNGGLAGDFWSRDNWHETWVATKAPDAEPPDPFAQSKVNPDVALSDLVYQDLDANPRSLADPAFTGRARIIELFGSWCPNCHDAADLLGDLHKRYADRGLSIVGLAFELTGRFERDARQVRRYARRHDISFPLLIAGTSDKKKASEVFPLLDRVRAYPTTIFLDATGRVRAVCTGFSGPATGADYEKLRHRFESIVEKLLAGAGGSPAQPSSRPDRKNSLDQKNE